MMDKVLEYEFILFKLMFSLKVLELSSCSSLDQNPINRILSFQSTFHEVLVEMCNYVTIFKKVTKFNDTKTLNPGPILTQTAILVKIKY
ncbi:hypothetical protein BpHYR1_053044 [Brachionus plicatilis]|uniref:Uncharacterized protein n=1 Tax=Brachionus plicatilis TaxID=10195 RepID=A0A3M7T0C8_BRAPC|nr:hypothetical protein BpHYR1_053044 [Brachionus plicatilis]